MNDAHTHGTQPVYHEEAASSRQAGARIDGEAPHRLTEDQMDRHTEAVTEALRARGLEVHSSSRDPWWLSVEHADQRRCADVQLDDERGGTWETGGEISGGSTSGDIADLVARVIDTRPS